MSLLDGFILVVLLGGLVHGFSAGAVRQVASLVGVVMALLLSVQLMHPVGDLTVESLGLSDAVAPIVGFVVVFLGVWLVFFALSRLLEQLLETLSLTLVNRLAGGALGAFKTALLLSVLFLVLAEVDVPAEETRADSTLYGPIAGALPATLDVASEYFPAAERATETFGRHVRPSIRSQTSPAP